MAANLILSLKAPGLKLAASLRTVSWLRRILPDLDPSSAAPGHGHDSQEKVLGALFLVCRLATLMTMLDALEPLARAGGPGESTAEVYWKRKRVVRRPADGALSQALHRNLPRAELRPSFPCSGAYSPQRQRLSWRRAGPLEPLPAALSTFPLHLVDMLVETLRL